MSKYIAIIDLPNAKACNCCHPLDCFEDGTGRCPILDREIVCDGITWIRPTDCPLIPVDRVIGSVFNLDASVQYGVSTDDVASMLRDELGVTE